MMHSKDARRLRSMLAAIVGCAVAIVMLAMASMASATPKGIFAKFSDCPAHGAGVTLCTFGQTTSGEVTIGSTTVPINKTITQQAGGVGTGELNEYFLVPALDGNSLSKTELNVPGGLADLINCEDIKGSGLFEILERGTCKTLFENKVTGVTATTELVANTKNPAILNLARLFTAEGTGLTLPVRVHLKNPLLGNSCYIGSEASPIQLRLTTGTTSPEAPNKPITGKVGTPESEEEAGLEAVVLRENTLVDNSFSVPVAEGCGEFFSFLIDPIVDSKLGLPSKNGHNTAILSGTLWSAVASEVIASE
jgi:hypothetical protein